MAFSMKLGLALAALCALAACATEPPRRGHGRMHGAGEERASFIVRPGALLLIDLDADRDLRVSQAELEAGAPALFAAADANHDGALSPLEYEALARAHLGTANSVPGRLSFDANADNAISREEFMAGMRALFERFDADHDGFVTRPEMIEQVDAGRPAAAAEGEPGGFEGRRRRGP